MNRISQLIATISFCMIGQVEARTHAYIVADALSGRILAQKHADASCYPASLTKKMTLFLLFEAIQEGRISFQTKFIVSDRAARQIPSKLGVKPGELVSVKTIVEALIVKSANDIAVVAAEGLYGSEKAFVAQMNFTARSLGMHRTHFSNASGCPNKKQKTTARDMALLARALFVHFPQFSKLFQLRSFKYKGRTYYTHNKLLDRFQGTNGIKTGYIAASGYNISTSIIRYDAQKRPYHLIAVVLGKNSEKERDDEVIAHVEPILLRCNAVYYSPFLSLFGKHPGIMLTGARSLALRKPSKQLLRAPVFTQKGMNILMRQYLQRNESNAKIIKLAANMDGLLTRFPRT